MFGIKKTEWPEWIQNFDNEITAAYERINKIIDDEFNYAKLQHDVNSKLPTKTEENENKSEKQNIELIPKLYVIGDVLAESRLYIAAYAKSNNLINLTQPMQSNNKAISLPIITKHSQTIDSSFSIENRNICKFNFIIFICIYLL